MALGMGGTGGVGPAGAVGGQGVGGKSGKQNDRDREAGLQGGGGFGSGRGSVAAVQGQMHKNRQAEIARTAKQTGAGTGQINNSGRTEAGLTHDTFSGMGRDYRNDGGSFIDKIGNFLASNFGFNEMNPTKQAALDRVRSGNPTVNGLDNRADWGFDPAGMIGSALGAGLGVPMVGTIFDRLSQLVGRPLEMNMGTSVLGLDGVPTRTGGTPGPGASDNMAARNASYMSGRTVRPGELDIQTASGTPGSATSGSVGGTTGGMVGGNAGNTGDASSADRDFGANSSAVAASRSPFNSSIGGFSGGGFAMDRTKGGGSGRTTGRGHTTGNTKLAEGLLRYRGPYEMSRAV